MSYFQSFNGKVEQHPLTIEEIGKLAPSALQTRPHESRSDRYTYIPTLAVIEGMIKAGYQPFSASQSNSRIEGKREFTKHMIRFRHQDFTGVLNDMAVGDLVPEVVLVNAHDGTSAYKLFDGIFRKVCMNGLFVADSTVQSISVQHKGDIVREVINASNQLLENSQKSLGAAKQWSQLQLTEGEQNAYAQSAHILRFADSEGKVSTPITPGRLLRPRRVADDGNDLWKTFNRVQENVIKGGLRGWYLDAEGNSSRRTTTRQVRGIDQDVKLNRALWMLAEKMAELKQGSAVISSAPIIDAEIVQ